MATHMDISAFLTNLLAPLPEGEEPVDTPKFRKTMERDICEPWRHGMQYVDLAVARHQAAAIEHRLSGLDGIGDECHSAYVLRKEAERRQCLIPPPTAKELRWKLRSLAAISDCAEVKAAIAADRARLGVQ